MGEIRSPKFVWLKLWCIKFQASMSTTAFFCKQAIFYSYRSLNKEQSIIHTIWYLWQLRQEAKKSSDMRKVKAMSYFKSTSYDQCEKTIICEMMFMPWSNAIIPYNWIWKKWKKIIPISSMVFLLCSNKSSLNRWIKILKTSLPLPS